MIHARLIGSTSLDHYLMIERVSDHKFFDWETQDFRSDTKANDRGLFKSYFNVRDYKFLEATTARSQDFTNVDLNFIVLSSWGWPFPKRILSMNSIYLKEPQYGIRMADLAIIISFPKAAQ